MILDPYLVFDGTCAAAMRFYEATLGGKLTLMTYGESPAAAQSKPEEAGKIMHARLEMRDRTLMASDSPTHFPYEGMHGFSLSLGYKDADEGRRIFDTLAAGGRVTMPFGKTFWASGFGMLVDRFGTPWMVNVE